MCQIFWQGHVLRARWRCSNKPFQSDPQAIHVQDAMIQEWKEPSCCRSHKPKVSSSWKVLLYRVVGSARVSIVRVRVCSSAKLLEFGSARSLFLLRSSWSLAVQACSFLCEALGVWQCRLALSSSANLDRVWEFGQVLRLAFLSSMWGNWCVLF